ncbi:Outer membrane protein TolC [Polaromonas vacuolata]|uniref:Outer membrane protein TolC n=1 Tax=Polaromonas vacuolata TaxID=37448 RepID=A0A6H2H6S5_9BURK|nr:TolC family outer membrane protein [Polaromonas vacuolata]QJC55467.1 Outer membrane protein TolC [Polaromonas vacuolata]
MNLQDKSPMPLAIAGLLLVSCLTAKAQSLGELYTAARAFDASYQSARLQYDATVAKADQTRAGLLPSAGLSLGASASRFENSAPVIERSFSNQSLGLTASQPLYRPANWASYLQSQPQVAQARAQLDAAEQDLILRASQSYFDVLAAQDTLTFVLAQKSAVSEQLASAKRNFEVGTATITDTREAQARFDLVVAQEIAADNDLRIKKIALDQLVGRTGTQPLALATPTILPSILPADPNSLVDQAEALHPLIRQAKNGLEVAELEIQKAQAGHKPTLDLNASYNVARNPSGTATTSALAYRTNTGTVGLLLNVPIFSGFSVENRIRETLFLRDKSQSDLEGARRSVAQATRTAFYGVVSNLGQVKALEAAELSSQSALDANKLGYQVGVRINIDVLNSQSQLFQTKRDLAQARYNVLLGGLRLRQANGSLTELDLQPVQALLVAK